ncbi:uncharacterized protein MEPE_06671 [Melanopsichium pennsylvanicum]|uniref:Uncharacterized protein n=2 Tax=Melanopsichium pennsylvanicum TaxID=63383 RepID=A0AAJ5C8F9_9BASI|nr:conserved hypothetical protein [Melanopsichium pennsylvanicum 4]SNX87960.1 uncharacterized protein MEPE_06671 [Melanopsichium pennsylvanicum]
MSRSSTTGSVLRSLQHLNPPTKGSKFAVRAPSHAAHQPKFVQPKDRIPFWNIVPGDHVKLRCGRVGQKEGLDSNDKLRGEGIVVSIDRQKNWVWLRDVDDNNKLAPKSLRHIVPRFVDPLQPEKGYGPNTTEIPRPVHYSNVMLKIPGSDQYAVRLSRSAAKYHKRKGMWVWKRFATIKASDDKLRDTGKAFEKVEVPWPTLPGKRKHLDSTMSDRNVVEAESWAPWRPEDPVLLPERKGITSPQSERRAALLALHRSNLDSQRVAEAGPSAPADALGSYAGFKQARAKPPPIAQPPTPAETIRLRTDAASKWASGDAIQAHRQEGGLAFLWRDYLDIAPQQGPASGGDWSELPDLTHEGGLDARRSPNDGRLTDGVSRNDVDRMPIELLMAKDLANESGLKWRMRRWQDKQAEKQRETIKQQKARSKLLKELDALKI